MFILQYNVSTTVMDLLVVFALFAFCVATVFRRIKIYIIRVLPTGTYPSFSGAAEVGEGDFRREKGANVQSRLSRGSASSSRIGFPHDK